MNEDPRTSYRIKLVAELFEWFIVQKDSDNGPFFEIFGVKYGDTLGIPNFGVFYSDMVESVNSMPGDYRSTFESTMINSENHTDDSIFS